MSRLAVVEVRFRSADVASEFILHSFEENQWRTEPFCSTEYCQQKSLSVLPVVWDKRILNTAGGSSASNKQVFNI